MTAPLLALTHITKRFGTVLANDDVSLTVQPGQAHAVLGENGAGKSTLMKMIYGALQADAGQMQFDGQAFRPQNPAQARAVGIGMVYQHFSLFDTLSVAENVWLGLDKSLTLANVKTRIAAKASEYGLDIDPERPVHTLSVGEMQRVEIIRALLGKPKLLILDEPTSVLSPQAVEKLFVVLKQLVAQGCSLLYISHKLHEIRALCSACTVLRGGRVAGVCDPRLESNASLSRLMIGAEPPAVQPSLRPAGERVLAVQALSLPRSDPFGTDLQGIDLAVHAGEIVGIAGVSGNGQRELLRALSGEDRRAAPNCIAMDAPHESASVIKHVSASLNPNANANEGSTNPIRHAIAQLNPQARRKLGLHFVPEERLGRGAVPSMGLAYNVLLTRSESLSTRLKALGWINQRKLAKQAQSTIAQFKVKTANEHAAARTLSGGNLQKFIVGREVSAKPRLLIVAQPTWGVDVGAAAQIRAELLALRDADCAVLIVSDELDELFELCDRLHVMAHGKLSPSLPRSEANAEKIGEWMSGLWPVTP